MGLYSQSYGFSISHIWMRELDHKEDWVPENWYFWTVVLGKTLESPLDYKEIQTVHPKGNQSSVFIGRTHAEAEALILLPVQFSHSVVSDSLWPHGLQHARPPCPSPTPGVYPNSRPLSRWCHPTISSSVVPFSSHLQSFPALESFQINQFFTSGGQSIGVSASASVLPMNIQDWFPLGWTGWLFLLSRGLSRVFSNTTVQKHQFFNTQLSIRKDVSNSHIHTWLLEKP